MRREAEADKVWRLTFRPGHLDSPAAVLENLLKLTYAGMGSNKNESVGKVMEVPGLLPLLLLLTVPSLPCQSLSGLTCFSDLNKAITCSWNMSAIHPVSSSSPCYLRGELTRHRPFVSNCQFNSMEGSDTLQSCRLEFPLEFDQLDTLPIRLSCGNYTFHFDYKPVLFVQMHPPKKPGIDKSILSWDLGSPHSELIWSYRFELQYKPLNEPWPKEESGISLFEKSVELPESSLEKGRLYEARVRVEPSVSHLKGVWSRWSPTVTWKSEVGSSLETDNSRSLPGLGPVLQVTLGLVAAAVALLVLITCKFHRAGWVYRLKLPHVPSPSTYFHSLNSAHGGNFQKWLSPMFSPESFDVPLSFEDISAVELFIAKDATALNYGEPTSDCTVQWGSSSKPTSSNSVEVCPGYIGYKSGSVLSGEEGGGGGVELQNTPLQVCCSYEQLGGESNQVDPGCREGNEEEEEEEEGADGEEEEEEEEEEGADGEEEEEVEEEEKEEEEGIEIEGYPKEMDSLPPQIVLPCSISGPLIHAHFPQPPHLPSIPLLRFPFSDLDSDTPTGGSNVSGQLAGGESPFAKIEPSSGDYMSVQNARWKNV